MDPADVIIHVVDEGKGINKDFKCEKEILLKYMKYFEKFVKGDKTLDDIDISVHCDITIFQWLMNYVKKAAKAESDGRSSSLAFFRVETYKPTFGNI